MQGRRLLMNIKIRKFLLLSAVLMLFLFPTITCGQTTKTITLNYSESDFEYEYNEDEELTIYNNHSNFRENEDEPALPYLSYYVLVGKDEVFDSLTIQTQEQIVMADVMMAHNPSIQTISEVLTPVPEDGNRTFIPFMQSTYPSLVAEYNGTHVMNGYKILEFSICPYIYETQTQTLKFTTAMILHIHKHTASSGYSVNYSELERKRNEIMHYVVNPEDVTVLYPIPTASNGSNETPTLANTPTQYLIITKESLANSFEPLARWKTCKGVKTEIVTTEQIYANDSTQDSQELKIKKYIRNFRTANNNALEYVMLGGYGSIIPSLWCTIYNPVKNTECNIKTDYYYSCLDGEDKGFAFDWNGNGNNKYGEPTDNLDLFPDICISRLPVETPAHAETMVRRIIEYEKNPLISTWQEKMLLCGVQMGNNIINPEDTIPSDAQQKGENLYNSVIRNHWNGTAVRFYDTYTDFEGGKAYNVSDDHLQDQLSQGYMFVDVMTHGLSFLWNLENGSDYTFTNASSLLNTQPTIIMTTACHTNYVGGNGDTSLSGSFMQNPNSGVVAYFGCSDTNLGNLNCPALTLGWEYEVRFYEELFSGYSGGNVGEIFKSIKNRMGKKTTADIWLLFSWHVSGDPEMPIYTTTPMDPSNLHFGLKYNGDLITTGIGDYDEISYCIMDAETGGSLYYAKDPHVECGNINIDMSDLPDDFLLCLNWKNHPSKIYEIVKGNGTIYVQDKEIDNDSYWFGNRFVIGSHVTNDQPVGPVIIENGKTEIRATKSVLINGEFEVKKGAELVIKTGI